MSLNRTLPIDLPVSETSVKSPGGCLGLKPKFLFAKMMSIHEEYILVVVVTKFKIFLCLLGYSMRLFMCTVERSSQPNDECILCLAYTQS